MSIFEFGLKSNNNKFIYVFVYWFSYVMYEAAASDVLTWNYNRSMLKLLEIYQLYCLILCCKNVYIFSVELFVSYKYLKTKMLNIH